MTFEFEGLRELPGLLAGRLPGAAIAGSLTDAELTRALAVIGDVRRALDGSAAVVAAEVARRSARDLGTGGLAQRRGHKDGTGLVEELTGVGRGEAAKLIRVGGLLETAEAVAPLGESPSVGGAEGVEGAGGRPGDTGGGAGRVGFVDAAPLQPERDLAVLSSLPGPWDAVIAVALRNHWLSAAQSDSLRSGLSAPRSPELAGAWRKAALELIHDCWSAEWNPEDVARASRRTRAALDGIAAQEEARGRYERRSLKRFVRASGLVHYDIDLDPESDARFYGPIRRLLSPRFGGPRFVAESDVAAANELERDPRTNEQLQADTLVELVDRAVSVGAKDLFTTGEPQVMVAVTRAELAKARDSDAAFRRHHAGDHSGCRGGGDADAGGSSVERCPGPDVGVAWIDGRDEPITALDALRMVCANGFTPALFDETGQAIDIGKDQRFFTRSQRRALAKRDGGCRYPRCDRPPEDCEAHHINPWAAHPTHRRSEVRDGVLLCRRHHKLIHDHGAHIARRGEHYWLNWPRRRAQLMPSKAGLQTQLSLAI